MTLFFFLDRHGPFEARFVPILVRQALRFDIVFLFQRCKSSELGEFQVNL